MIRPGAGSVTVHLAWISRTRSAGAIKSKMGGGFRSAAEGADLVAARGRRRRDIPHPPLEVASRKFSMPRPAYKKFGKIGG